ICGDEDEEEYSPVTVSGMRMRMRKNILPKQI
ncbi:hypothetical protein A2U01_0112609, partial [Trifolium medium]|nr:hypothetical protein [Trifolium medium]